MPVNGKDSSFVIQNVALSKILEGLIHNINTPLNLILGYAYQLQKHHPDLPQVQKIYDAGIQLDDMVHNCLKQINLRTDIEMQPIDLAAWLLDEIKLFQDDLDIKHSIFLKLTLPDNIVPELFEEPGNVMVMVNPMLLSITLESVILQFVRNQHAGCTDNQIQLILSTQQSIIRLSIILPSELSAIHLQADDLKRELEDFFDFDFAINPPFDILQINNYTLEIQFLPHG
jgi:signal transduction histidine kinase